MIKTQSCLVLVFVILSLLTPVACCHADVPQTISVTPAGFSEEVCEPQAAVTGAGSVYVTYGAGDTVYCSASRDGGRTYAAPVAVAASGNLSLGMRRGPRIVITGKAVVISAIYNVQGKAGEGELLSWRSGDGGRTWEGPVRVNDVRSAAREGLHAMTASPDGRILACVWLDLRDSGTQIYTACSRDGGMTWGKNVRVYRSPEGTVCECCHPSATFDVQGDLFVMWRNALGGARDMFLARSTDAGATFGPVRKLGQGTWLLKACPMDGGAMAVTVGGAVTTFWRRDQQMFTCVPGRQEKLIGRGQQGWVANGHNGTYLVWLEGRPGRLKAISPGAEVSREIAALADDPVVAASYSRDSPVIAVWTERGKDGQGIRSLIL